jgi:hypothetical protein
MINRTSLLLLLLGLLSTPVLAQAQQQQAQQERVFMYGGQQNLTMQEVQMIFATGISPCGKSSVTDADRERDRKGLISTGAPTIFERANASERYAACLVAETAKVQVNQFAAGNNLFATTALQNALAAEVAQAKNTAVEDRAAAEFMDLGWGLGFGFSFGQDDFIEEAAVVDNVIRVTKDRTDRSRAMLEFHRYFGCNEKQTLTDRGCGPFLAVAADGNDVLAGVGIGFIYGRKLKNPTDSEGFSVGIGLVFDNDVKTLADGFAEGLPLPAGETGIRYEEKARWSTLLFVTRTF